MRFISPVSIMSNARDITEWKRLDLTSYIPVTATFVMVEVTAQLSRNADEVPAKLISRASNDPHALRTYTILEALVAEESILTTQALLPVGDATNVDLKVDNAPFDKGVTVEVIGFFEECPSSRESE